MIPIFVLNLNSFHTSYPIHAKGICASFFHVSFLLFLFLSMLHPETPKICFVINICCTMAGQCLHKMKTDQNLLAWSFVKINILTSIKDKRLWQLFFLCQKNYKAEDKLQYAFGSGLVSMEAWWTFKRNSRQFRLGSKEVRNKKRSSFLGLMA